MSIFKLKFLMINYVLLEYIFDVIFVILLHGWGYNYTAVSVFIWGVILV